MKTRLMSANPKHEELFKHLCNVMAEYDMPPLELLAVASNLVGKLVAMQDQRRVTPDMAMEIVSQNIEHGNQQMMAELGKAVPT